MKNSFKIVVFLSFGLVLFSSCSNEKYNEMKLLKEVVEIAADGTSTKTLLTYNGTQIVNIDGVQSEKDFTYQNGLITKIKTRDKGSLISSELEYSYDSDQLIQVLSPNNYVINYKHNADNTVSYEKMNLNSVNLNEKLYHGTLYFTNKNVVKDERVIDNAPDRTIVKFVFSFQFDFKKNPLYSILGYNKLLDQSEVISLNNTVNSVVENSVTNAEGQITSSIQFYKSTFKYDTDDYPTEQLTETANSGYVKSQYFY
jgi:hypothetical protein